MLVEITPKVIINPELIESMEEKEVLNPDHEPEIPGFIKGNDKPPTYTNVYICTRSGNVIILKNKTLQEISDILKSACK